MNVCFTDKLINIMEHVAIKYNHAKRGIVDAKYRPRDLQSADLEVRNAEIGLSLNR